MEALHRYIEKLDNKIYPPSEIWLGAHTELKRLLHNEVKPYSLADPSILIVGSGRRIEEATAALSVLSARYITVIETEKVDYKILKNQWENYLRIIPYQFRKSFRDRVSIRNRSLADINYKFDVVMAFSIDPSLEHEHTLRYMINLAKDMLVITANDNDIGAYSLRTTQRVVESDYIDQNLGNMTDIDLITRRKDYSDEFSEIADGNVWVARKNTAVARLWREIKKNKE